MARVSRSGVCSLQEAKNSGINNNSLQPWNCRRLGPAGQGRSSQLLFPPKQSGDFQED